MQMKKRLQIYVFVPIIMTFTIVVMLFTALYRVTCAMEEAEIAGDIVTSAFIRNTFKEDYLRFDNERAKVQWFAKSEQMGSLLRSASEKFKEAGDKKIIEEMIKSHITAVKLFSVIVENREKAKTDAEFVNLLQERENRLFTQMNISLYNRVLDANRLHEAAKERLYSALRLAGGGVIGAIAIVAAAAIINSWVIGRTVATRISKLQDGATIIGEGNLDYRIEIKGDDEFVKLSEAFNAMTAKLRLSHVDLEREIAERKQAETALQTLNDELENRVAERTEELETETAQRLRAVEELRQMDQKLIQQSRTAAMGEMLGNIAHHWRQPLNAVGLKIQQLGLSYEFGDFSKELLDANIAQSMEILLHLSKTIDDFRNFTSEDKEKTLFNVDEVIAKTVSLIDGNLRQQGITMEISRSGDTQINGYPNQYAHVLLNLLMNARDVFLERGTQDARIMVHSWMENGRVVVTVTDNAGGIKAEIADQIFDAFFTTKEQGKGTGVGLFISKTIIENNMGGRLTVRNTEEGAEFRIEV